MASKNPTTHSHRLWQLAQSIVEEAPITASEIILDGSVARGIADQFSDIELQFFSDQVPSIQEIIEWMKSIGFLGKSLVRLDEVDNKLIDDEYKGVRVELSWTAFAYEAEQLDGIMERIGSEQFINEAYKWSDAVAMRDGPHITRWKALFSHYPDGVRDKYIQTALDDWRITLNDPIETLGRWKDAYRNAWFYLLKTHWMDILPLLRIIFAFNRVWEPVAKWWHVVVPKLTYKPKNLVERVNDVLSNPDPLTRIDQLSKLQIETLYLIKDEYEVHDLIERLVEVREYWLKMLDKHL